MKIVFLSYTFWPPDFGGELLIAEERLADLAARGYQVVVLTAGADGYPSSKNVNGMLVNRSPFIGKNKISRILRRIIFWFWSLQKLLTASQVDIVHFNSLPGFETITANLYGGLAAWIAQLRKARTVYVHSLASEEGDFFTLNIWQRFFFSQIDHLVCVSDGLYLAAKKVYPHKVVEIVCGVRDDIFYPLTSLERQNRRREAGVSETDVVFTFLGTVGRRKGFDLIAEVFSEVNQQNKNWKLWVIGPRTRRENQNLNEQEVEQVAAPLKGFESAVRYWGRVDDRVKLAMIVGASDIFLFPSRKEGFGIAPLEAMGVAVPPIISRIPGVTDLANIEGETGVYTKPGDKEDLKKAMLQLAGDQALREAMGRKARQRIVKAFSWQQHVDRWEQLYQGSLNGR